MIEDHTCTALAFFISTEWVILFTEDLRYYNTARPRPLWARAPLFSTFTSSSETCARRPLNREALPGSGHHGYSCDLHPLHGRISAVRGTRKVSARLRQLLLHSACSPACPCVHPLLCCCYYVRLPPCWQNRRVVVVGGVRRTTSAAPARL